MASFYASEPPPVRAVLELCSLRDIAEQLYWIDRLSWAPAAPTLRAFHGDPTMLFAYADQAADELSARLQVEAVTSAQLIASVRAVAA